MTNKNLRKQIQQIIHRAFVTPHWQVDQLEVLFTKEQKALIGSLSKDGACFAGCDRCEFNGSPQVDDLLSKLKKKD